MKKILLVLLTLTAILSCNPVVTKAQVLMYRNTDTTSTGTSTTAAITTGTSDTLYDANTLYSFYTKVGAMNAYTGRNYLMTFETKKVSGTGTARVYLQGSTDGINWRNVNTGMIGTDGHNSDTLAIAAQGASSTAYYKYYSVDGKPVYRPATNTAVFYVNSGRWFYFRVMIAGTGTQATLYKNFKLYTIN